MSLVLEGLCRTNGCDPSNASDPKTLAASDYVNPCPASRPCTLERACSANQDTRVDFNLTIMRSGVQGFFDIGVDFEDVFCSAKLDCVDHLMLRDDGTRDLTAVLGFACTSGASSTCLYAKRVTLDCGGTDVWTIDPSQGPGNVAFDSPLLFGAATYQGDEAFPQFEKSYWNISLGLDASMFETYPNCTLRWSTTAAQSAFASNPPHTPDASTYPFIEWQRDIVVDGALACSKHPLDTVLAGETDAAVHTAYTPVDAPATFPFSTCESSAPCTTGPDADNDGIPDACDSCPNGQSFNWVAWQNIGTNVATGTVGGLGVTYTSSAPLFTTGNVYNHAVFPSSYGVPNANPVIRNVAVTSNTLAFAAPVTNPMLAFSSIGAGNSHLVVPIQFSTPVKLLWCQGLIDGPVAATAHAIVCNGQTVSTIYGDEGFAIIEVPGTHTSIGFDYTVAEDYANFVFGFNTCNRLD